MIWAVGHHASRGGGGYGAGMSMTGGSRFGRGGGTTHVVRHTGGGG